MGQPFFSTIIPVYNRRELVLPAIESALNQSFVDQEIIVVDDGSTDGSAERVAERFGSRVQLIRQRNSGPGPARNAGIKAAVGKYIAFLDSDDRWFPWSLASYAQVASNYDQPAFITGRHRLFSDEAALSKIVQTPLQAEEFADYLASGDQWRWWGVSSFVIRRDALLAAGGFADDSFNGEDADLAMRLGIAPGFVHVVEPVTFAYREHDGNIRSDHGKNLAGVQYQLAQERAGRYPGGPARAPERRRILTMFARSLSLELLHGPQRSAGWMLYRQTFAWHLRLRRWKYLTAFPLVATLGRS